MQYIQLQGQVAAGLDLPLEGSYNLFIDTSDNSIKAKDFEGNLTGGGGGLSLIEVTREEVGQLVLSASLTPGAFYKITGVASASFYDDRQWSYTAYGNEIQDGGTTIILQASTDKTLSKKGVGLFYVPNYENPQVPTAPPDYNYLVWDSTSRLEFSSSFGVFDHDEYVNLYANGSSSYSNLRANIGVSSITLEAPDDSDFFTNTDNYPMSIVGYDSNAWAGIVDFYDRASYNVGDCVIWGGRVWTNRSGSVGYKTGGWPLEQLTLNEQDWTKVPFNETNYTIVADLIEYEFEWDNISYRKGANNVEVRCDAILMLDYWGYNMIKYFPWGHYGTQNISISNSYLDAFVNYPHDAQADQIKFADYGGFNAHYWGRETEIYNINGDTNAHMVSLNLGYKTQINDITLGQRAYISDIYTYDNDNGYTALYEIALGIDAAIDDNYDPIYMYVDSYMGNLILENNANISDINLYKGSRIKDSKLGIDSYIKTIALNNYADFRQVEVGNSSWIADMNLDVSSCFKRVKIGTDAYIQYVGLGVDGNFKHIEMADESRMNCIAVGCNSYFQYINLGISSEINSVIQTDTYLADTTASYQLPSTGSYFENINVGINSSIGGFVMGTYSSLNNFEVKNQGGFGNLAISHSVELSRFKIGQDFGFGGMQFSSSLYDITIDKGFNNFEINKHITGVTGSLNWADKSSMTQLDSSKSFIMIDTTGWDASTNELHYYLPPAQYEGHTVKLIAYGGGTNLANNAGKISVWMDAIRDPAQVGDMNYMGTERPWYPFATNGINRNGWRVDVPTAIWIDGAWTIDNYNWD